MNSPKWTNEQQSVIEHRNGDLLVAAAAGSGKTAVLVERIIKMITDEIKPIDIDKLLVVTFTNAAASEMRERIGDAIGEALDKDPENEHLQNQLILLNKASITTIHSFCLEVIKSNFHKINLDPNFRIGDATECNLLKQESIEEVFEQLYVEQDKNFLNLVESYAEKRGDINIQEIVLSVYNFAMASAEPNEWLKFSAEQFNVNDDFEFAKSLWASTILDTVKIEVSGIELNMKNALKELEGIEELGTYLEKFKSDYNKIKLILESCEKTWEDAYNVMSCVKFEDYRKGIKRIPSDAPYYIHDIKKISDSARNDAKKSINKMINSIFKKENEQIIDEFKLLYPISKAISDTVIRFEKVFSEKKREKGIIDFNDIEHFALKILLEKNEEGNNIPSDIAMAYKEKFYEIFIDEYQDSNFVQEYLLMTIAKVESPNRFMVGDVKQSIYRFRQAKPEIFLQKYANYLDDIGSSYRKILLYKNFRSRAEVIDCANYIFENIMSRNIGEIDYTEKERLNLGASFKENIDENAIVGGSTEIHLVQTDSKVQDKSVLKNNTDINETDNLESEGEEESLDKIQLEARMVGKLIGDLMELQEDGRIQKVYDKKTDEYRPVEFKDIVILLRATTNWAPVFAEELLNMGIPTYADIDAGYFESIEVKTILSLLQVIDNQMQDIPMLAVLRSPIFSFTPDDMISMRVKDKEKSFYEIITLLSQEDTDIGEKCYKFLAKMKDYKDKSLYMTTDEFLWYLYTKTGYFAYVGALSGGLQRQANLKILFERAKQFEETSFKGIFNFINFISRLKKSNADMGSAKTLGENANVVRIMSIHKSKGLEFPIVFCSGMGKKFNTQDFKKDVLYHHNLGYGPQLVDYKRRISYPSIAKESLKSQINIENLSEEMRILYVAFTRPKEKLIITGSAKDIKKSFENWANGIEINRPISQYKILKGNKFLDWIMPSVIKHNDLSEIRKKMGLENNSLEMHDSKWITKIWYKEDISENTDMFKEKDNIDRILEKINLEKADTWYYDTIIGKLEYQYPFGISVKTPSSISVTEIKKIQNNNEEQYCDEIFKKNSSMKIPVFLQNIEESDKISGAQKGTIIHLIMEILDLNKIETIEDIQEQINKFIKNGVITEKQASVISPIKIYKFFKSTVGERLLKSCFVKKEQAIYAQINIKDISKYKELIKSCDVEKYNNESVMLRGIVDAYFEENNKIVIVDYKTDYVTQENKLDIANKYKVQLRLYAEVIENLTGKEVKETCIYLFGIDECIYI